MVDWERTYVGQTEDPDFGSQGSEDEEPGDVETDHVGEICRRCGGMDQYARECPT